MRFLICANLRMVLVMKRYDFIDHTADVAVRVYGASLKELFQSAALAMFAVLIGKKKNRPKAALRALVIEKEAETPEDLLKAWLDELLFNFSTKQLILHRIKSLECRDRAVKADVLFDAFDPEYYEARDEIKAVTYHGLKIEKVRNRWRAFIIFDV